MEKEQLLGTLDKLIARYEQHRAFIDKATSQIGKFSAAVIERVILDHEVKSAMVADEIGPLMPALQSLIGVAETERVAINASKAQDLLQIADGKNLDAVDDCGFGGIRLRDKQAPPPLPLGFEGDGEHSLDRTHRSIQPQLADDAAIVGIKGLGAAGRDHRQRDG